MINKKGLSDVITTVLIILLVLAAVIIIWVFVRPALFKAGSQLESGVLTSSFTIVPSLVYVNESSSNVTLVVKRNAGQGSVRGIQIVLEDANKNRKSFRFDYNATGFNELETRLVSINYSASGLGSLASISVAPIVLNKDGAEITAPISDTFSSGSYANTNSGSSNSNPNPNLGTISNPGTSCYNILTNRPNTLNQSGAYWIDPDGAGYGNPAFQVYCDMTNFGGGWTLVVGIAGNSNHLNTLAVTPENLNDSSGFGKYSDVVINSIKSGTSPAYRLTCSGVVGFFNSSCVFAATSQAGGDCIAINRTAYLPGLYAGSSSQGNIVGLADGNQGTSDRLVYGEWQGHAGCDIAAGWAGRSGTLYVR